MTSILKKSAIALACALLAACSLTPDFHLPGVKTPEKWQQTENAKAATDLMQWRKSFGNAELAALQDKAVTQNLDMAAARARVLQARGLVTTARSGLFPSLDAGGSIGATHNDASNAGTRNYTSAEAGLSVSYDADIFGGNSASVTAAKARLEGSVFAQEAVRLAVESDISSAYAAALTAQERIYVARSHLNNAENTLKVLQSTYEAGLSTALEPEQQKTAIASDRAALAALERTRAISISALAVLMGEPAPGFNIYADGLKGFNVPDISPDAPATLITRRPDIRAAEADLIAANADIGAARAAFLPALTLSGAASLAASPIYDPVSILASALASATAPIFDGGARKGALSVAKGREKELAATYQKTVLTAFKEVQDALAGVKSAKLRQEAFAAAAASAAKAYNISEGRFKAGAIDYITVLDAERSLLFARENLELAKLERIDAAIDLYRALGGGWEKPKVN